MSAQMNEENRLRQDGAPDVLSEALNSEYIPFCIETGAGNDACLCMDVFAGERFVLYYEGPTHEWLNPLLDYSMSRDELATTIEESIVQLRDRLDEAGVHYDKTERNYVFGSEIDGCSCCGPRHSGNF